MRLRAEMLLPPHETLDHPEGRITVGLFLFNLVYSPTRSRKPRKAREPPLRQLTPTMPHAFSLYRMP
jgi:hypothetical protein